ncbi:hypothetical protein [Pseudofrankia sp. BMG5.37]|uniref:hypothetical protein n=1 Tax=Pseudofrankia sp. BMG5.37 TaxID=3050035 RepID=UPI002893C626|nr:hypothetical protein [Pseudofrankia sp. BMG5.37]MDT3440293.1 hypothetical protein [Pseudofrankia sp. BMG5.37]
MDDAQVAGFRQKIIDIVSRLDQTISDSRDQEKAGTVAGKANESQLGEVIQFRPRREGVRSPGQNPPDLWHNFFDVLLGTSFDSRDPATFAADTMALRMMLLGAHPRAPVQPDRIAEIVDELRRCLQNAVTAGTNASELARCADSCEQFRGWLVGITNQRRSIT